MDDVDPRLEVSICNEDGYYDLQVGENHFVYPGLVLIFNQIDFTQNQDGEIAPPQRLEEPGIDLKETMEKLGFKVHYYKNFKLQEIKGTIEKFALLKSYDKKVYASFMLFFLSHGDTKVIRDEFHEVIKTADDDMLISDTWKPFQTTKTWNNKPKCFFFQTCRGMDLVEGVKVDNRKRSHVVEEGYDTQVFKPSDRNRRGNRDGSFKAEGTLPFKKGEGDLSYDGIKHGDKYSLPTQGAIWQTDFYDGTQTSYLSRYENTSLNFSAISFTEPKFSDLLIVHSTYQGASSFREPDYSPFINVIITNFLKDFFKKDLFSIVQNIQKEIAYKFHASSGAQRDANPSFATSEVEEIEVLPIVEGSRLMPMIESTLTGKICYKSPENHEMASIFSSEELPEKYNMETGKGKAVIFANKIENIRGMPFVTADVANLEKSFEMLNCDLEIHWDLVREDFLNILNNLGSLDFSHYDFFCLVFYGYGINDHLVLNSEEDYVEVAELWQPFLGSSCPSLIDKPKFFIISANGIHKPGISGKFRRFVKRDANIENTRALNDEAKCDPGEVPLLYVIPEASDFLLLIHSAVGTAKYMDFIDDEDENDDENYTQSIFFQKLNEQLQNMRNFAGDRNLLDLIVQFQYNMTMIIKENVAVTRESSNKREVPLILSTLTKNFVLNINQK